MLEIEGGQHPNEPSEYGFHFLADEEEETKVGIIRVVLPFAAMNEGGLSLLPTLEELIGPLEFESGHAGYSINWDSRGDWEEEAAVRMGVIAKRYPGVDLNDYNSTIIAFQGSSRPSIKCVNWLTLVGSDIRDALPRSEALGEQLGNECIVRELPQGLIFQAGERPGLGVANKPESLGPYCRVGELLADFRLLDHPQIIAPSSPGEDPTEDWLARFDSC